MSATTPSSATTPLATVSSNQRDVPTAAATTSLTQSIEKLDGSMASGRSNYQAWKFRIIRILKEKGLVSAIEEALDKGNSKAVSRDNAAFTILTLNVKDSQITHIQECGTAKAAWEALRIIHQGIGATGRMVLMQRLWALRMVEGDDMAEHLNKFKELASKVGSLSGNGKGMEDNELVTLLSLSVPESYEPIIMALQSRADDVSFDIFASKLLQESARRQVANNSLAGTTPTSSAAAFTALHSPTGRGGGRYGRGRGGFRIPNGSTFGKLVGPGSVSRTAGTTKGKGKCFYCNKEGNWKRDCYQRKNDEAKDPNSHTPNSQPSLAFTVHDNGMRKVEEKSWILDSGASQHLCSLQEVFVPGSYRQTHERGIEIADGSKIVAVGVGDVSIGQLQLTNVLHVPRVGGNLISVARLIDSGYEVSFAAEACIITKKDLRVCNRFTPVSIIQ